jgi:hypothetical protein
MLEKFAFEKTKRERENLMKEKESSRLRKSADPKSGERNSFWSKVKSIFTHFQKGSGEDISTWMGWINK